MRGRGANVMVLAAKRQVLGSLLCGTQRASHPNLVVKSTTRATPLARLLHSWTVSSSTKLHEQLSPRALVHHRIQSLSTAASQAAAAEPEPEKSKDNDKPEKSKDNDKPEEPAMEESHYWGLVPKTLHKEDGTPWKWTCFSPHQAYHPDVTIDLELHHKRKTLADSIAYWTVKSLRLPTDLFFQKRYGCRAMMLETVAAVPGMVAGLLLHCKSLRRFETSGGWIKALLEEAENERMHLMTFMEVAQPKWWERALVFIVQGIWFNAYFLTYIISPRFAHRLTGYLEEEAIWSYSHFLQEIDNGHIPNDPAPAIAIDYWRLPANATIRDVVIVVRADEAHHRDVNHFAADIHEQGKELRESPAPLGFK